MGALPALLALQERAVEDLILDISFWAHVSQGLVMVRGGLWIISHIYSTVKIYSSV